MATGRIGVTPTLRTRWSKAPAGGTTSLSGLDDNSVSLVYDVGYEGVYRNGVLLSRGNDYTATDGTTVTLIDATIAGDIIEIFANELIPLSDAISKGQYTAKGALLSATAASTPGVLTVGSNDQVLTADSSTSTGLKWATPASGVTFVGARAGRVNNNQTINNNTNTVVLWDSEAFQPNFDTDSIHSTTTNTGRFTVPTGKGGYWLCIATVQFEGNGTGIRAGDFLINTDLRTKGFRLTPSSATDTVYSASTVLKLVAADYVEFQVYQNSGTSLAIQGDSYNNQFVFTFLGA